MLTCNLDACAGYFVYLILVHCEFEVMSGNLFFYLKSKFVGEGLGFSFLYVCSLIGPI